MRRISTGQVGSTVLGTLVTENNTIRTLSTSDDLTLLGSTVEVSTGLDLTGANPLRIYDAGSNYVEINAPSLSGVVNFTLPSDTGAAGQFLRSDGSGNLSYAGAAISVQNQSADATTYYPLMSTSTTGNITGVSVSNNKLEFTPSTGTLSVSLVSGDLNSNNVDINGGAIDGTTVGANSAANGTFTNLTATSITETSSIALKENVSPIVDALDAVTKLSGVTYDRKDGSSMNEAGLIKEDVEKVLPNLVTQDGIYYTKLTAYLIEAVKELTRELAVLKDNKS